MALVAYDASSGDETDSEEDETKIEQILKTDAVVKNGHCTYEEDDTLPFHTEPAELIENECAPGRRFLNLPKPSQSEVENLDTGTTTTDSIHAAFETLPTPISKTNSLNIIEEDDEFLHKKAPKAIVEKPPPSRVRVPVKITIPSLSEFKDVSGKTSKTSTITRPSKPSSLIGMLPPPKSSAVFNKPNAVDDEVKNNVSSTRLVPDSVKMQQSKAKASTSKIIESYQKPKKAPALIQNYSDSEGSDDDGGDFFSLNSEQKLPTVSENEINAMVAKRAAKMAEMSSKIDEMVKAKPITTTEEGTESSPEQYKVEEGFVEFDDKALHALVGSRAKRRKVEEVNMIELSSDQVLPNKDEWLRSAIASSTQYQPKGVLTDEEPAPGTRKKHQITYLAHQAKANEQELQAMWSANRHTRRQTQSKYGF